MKNNEKFFLAEQERQKREKTEKEKKAEQEKILKARKQQEFIHEEEEVERNLQKLKDLLEKHIIDDALVQKVIDHAELEHDEIEEIFGKIDEIETLENIDDYLPKDMRVSKEEYAHATHDDELAKVLVKKIEKWLSLLANHANSQSAGWSINIFSGFLTMLDKNLITIQEHHIDIKDSLLKNTPTKGIWESMKEGFR